MANRFTHKIAAIIKTNWVCEDKTYTCVKQNSKIILGTIAQSCNVSMLTLQGRLSKRRNRKDILKLTSACS